MPRLFYIVLVFGLALPALAGAGEVADSRKITVENENKLLAKRLEFARNQVRKRQWTKAIDSYERLIRESGDILVPVTGPQDVVSSALRSVQMRRLVHQDIAALPLPALKLYRQRHSEASRRWLEQASGTRDEALLSRIVNDAFCSESGDDAVDLLGDLAFERGDFSRAMQWWRMLTAPASQIKIGTGTTGGLNYPSPDVDLDRVRAKLILATLFAGDRASAQAEFAYLKKSKNSASGHFAGKKGSYKDILQKWWQRESPDFGGQRNYATFSGNAARSGLFSDMPHSRLWVDGPTWRHAFVNKARSSNAENSVSKTLNRFRRLRYFPIVVNNRVLFCDDNSITMLDLMSGQLLDRFGLPDAGRDSKTDEQTTDGDIARYSLTAQGENVFAVLGANAIAPPKKGKFHAVKSHLVCVKLNGQRRARLTENWNRLAQEAGAEVCVYSAAPLAAGNDVYVALACIRDSQLHYSLVCLDQITGEQRWRRKITSLRENLQSAAVVAQPGLTLAGNNLIFCSQQGFISAVNAEDGKPLWTLRYPSRGPIIIEGTPSPRDLTPCVFANGRLFAAPMDCDRIYCLHPETGATIWERDRIQVVHLLGCRRGKLIFTTSDGVRAVAEQTGKDSWIVPSPAFGRLTPRGRGILAGQWVMFPTEDPDIPLRILHVDSGAPQHSDKSYPLNLLRKLAPGNMILANGCLIVATEDKLIGYIAPRHLLKKRQEDAKNSPTNAESQIRLAQSYADAGSVDTALALYKAVEKTAGQSRWDEEYLAARSMKNRHKLLLNAAKITSSQDLTKAVHLLNQAAKPGFSAPLRARALVMLAELYERRKQFDLALAAWKRILDGQELNAAAICAGNDIVRCGHLAETAITQMSPEIGKPSDNIQTTANKSSALPSRYCTTEIILPAEINWQTKTGDLPDQVAQIHQLSESETFFTGNADGVACRDAATGKVRWQTPLPFTPNWIGTHRDKVYVAGRDGFAQCNISNGELLSGWLTAGSPKATQFSILPDYRQKLSDGIFLSEFRLDGSSLHFLQNGQRRLATNADFARITIKKYVLGSRVRPCGNKVTRTGEISNSSQCWPRSDAKQVGIGQFRITEDGRVQRLDANTKTVKWTYSPRLPTTLSGEKPQIFVRENALMFLIARNYGYDLERVDPASGKNLWQPSARLCAEAVAANGLEMDAENVYYASGNRLYCRKLTTGEALWQQTLPDMRVHWCLRCTKRALVAYPDRPRRRNLLLPAGDLCIRTFAYDHAAYPFAVQFHDFKDGRLLQRLDFDWTQDGGRIRFFSNRMVVTANGRSFGISSATKR